MLAQLKMMKYLIWLFILCLSLGCQKPPSNLKQWMEPNHKIKVLSTTQIIDDLVGEIGGDRIDHLPMISGGMDPHSYELVKGDDEKLKMANLIFYNGLGLEHGASLCFHLKKHPKTVALGEMIQQNHRSAILIDKGQIDPHIWLDVSLWAEAIEPIVQALSESDPNNSSYYEERGKLVKDALLGLDEVLAKKTSSIPSEKRYLVTTHDAFNYFTRRYLGFGESSWKDRFCAPEGLAPDGQLSCQDIQDVVDYIEKHQVSVVFPEANVSQDSLKKIVSVCAEKKQAVQIAKTSLYSDTLGPKGSSCDTYQKMMEHNVSTIYSAWMPLKSSN